MLFRSTTPSITTTAATFTNQQAIVRFTLKNKANDAAISATSFAFTAQRCEQVTVGGESGSEARVCDYAWVLGIREQCIAANVPFYFKQTGAHFRKDGRLYNIPRNQQMKQAYKAGIDYALTVDGG